MNDPVTQEGTMSSFRRRLVLGLVCAASLAFAATLPPSARAQTVDEIIKRGKVQIAIDITNPPHGTMGADMKPDGYEVAIARSLAKAMGVELDLVPVTSQNRISFILTERCDILIAGLTVTAQRSLQVWFTSPYSVNILGVIAEKGKAISKPADLAGLRVGTVRAQFGEPFLVKAAPPGTNIMRFDDLQATMQALLAGQVDAIAENWLIPAELNKLRPGRDYETKLDLSKGYWGMAIRRGQSDLLQYLNSFVFTIKASGELDELHRKYIGLPLPELPVL